MPLATLSAFVAIAAETTHSDALPDSPDRRHIGAERGDSPHDLVTRNARRLQGRIGSFDICGIRAAYPASLDRNQHFAGRRRGSLAFHQFKDAGAVADKLMDEDVYPVCSPSLLRGPARLQKPADLARETLIHDLSMDSRTGFPAWDTWLRKAGVMEVDTARGMQINNSAAVLQAAID